MCQGLNSHYFHIIGDKLINPIVGVYIPIKKGFPSLNLGGMTMAHITPVGICNQPLYIWPPVRNNAKVHVPSIQGVESFGAGNGVGVVLGRWQKIRAEKTTWDVIKNPCK